MKTVSAFSNYNGGEIFFGIDDNGNIKGLSDVHSNICTFLIFILYTFIVIFAIMCEKSRARYMQY